MAAWGGGQRSGLGVEVTGHHVVRGISRPFCSCGWRADVGVDPDVAADAHLAHTPPASSPGSTVLPGLVAAGADRFGVADVDGSFIDGARVGDLFGEHAGRVVLPSRSCGVGPVSFPGGVVRS